MLDTFSSLLNENNKFPLREKEIEMEKVKYSELSDGIKNRLSLLIQTYKSVYGEDLGFYEERNEIHIPFERERALHCAIFFTQQFGVFYGGYIFEYGEHGVESRDLSDDIDIIRGLSAEEYDELSSFYEMSFDHRRVNEEVKKLLRVPEDLFSPRMKMSYEEMPDNLKDILSVLIQTYKSVYGEGLGLPDLEKNRIVVPAERRIRVSALVYLMQGYNLGYGNYEFYNDVPTRTGMNSFDIESLVVPTIEDLTPDEYKALSSHQKVSKERKNVSKLFKTFLREPKDLFSSHPKPKCWTRYSWAVMVVGLFYFLTTSDNPLGLYAKGEVYKYLRSFADLPEEYNYILERVRFMFQPSLTTG